MFCLVNIVMSPRTYEDIAFGLALYTPCCCTHLKIKNLLEKQSEDFYCALPNLAQGIFEKHANGRQNRAERIAVRIS